MNTLLLAAGIVVCFAALFLLERYYSGGKKNGDKFGGGYAPPDEDAIGYGDAGSAARFFYCAKASKKDRNEGLDEHGVEYLLNGDAPGWVRAEVKRLLSQSG